MIYLRRLLWKFRDVFQNARVEEELEREITAHLALLEDGFLRKGMSAEEAHLAASCPDWRRRGSTQKLIRPEHLQPNPIGLPEAATIDGIPARNL